MALSDVQTLVGDLIRDDAGAVATAERDRAITAAVGRYGHDRPRSLVEDVTATAAGHILPLPASWETGFSALMTLEYPIGENPPAFLEPRDFALYTSPTGDEIRLRGTVASGAVARAAFTVRHLLDVSNDTIGPDDREAVASYAAAVLLDQLAARFSGDGDSSIQADSVDHNTRAQEYGARARGLRRRYHDLLGIKPARLAPGAAIADIDLDSSRGRDRLTHPRKYR